MDAFKTSFDDLLSLPLLSAEAFSAQSVTNISGHVHDWFWSEGFWLPEGVSWDDIAPGKGSRYPDHRDITTYPFLIAILFLLLKHFVVVPFVLPPLADFFGVRNKKKSQPEKIPQLEILYQNFGVKVPPTILMNTSNSLNWSTRQVELWLRKKENSQKETVYEKFIHVGFMAIYHVSFTIFGFIVLYDKPFVWDSNLFFEEYPFHEVSTEVWYYYMIGLGYFWFLTLSLIYESKSKEYIIDSIHHAVSILLMSFSWMSNFFRIGSLVLLLHSCSDAILFPAKMLVYSKKGKITDVVFALFVVVWTVTRIVVFPLHVVWNVLAEGFMSASLLLFDILLSCLFILHIRWTAIIFKVVLKKLAKGEVTDVRSSDEGSDSDEACNAEVASK